MNTKEYPTKSEDMALQVGAKQLHQGRQYMYEEAERYHNTFKDPSTGMFRQEFLEDRNCPVCNADKPSLLWLKGGGRYVKCNECQMCYLNPVFTDESLADFYRNNNNTQSFVVKNEGEFYSRIYGKGLAAISKFVPSGRILDVGCSTGAFLDIARDQGWDTWGVELNQVEVKEAIAKKHTVHTKLLEECDFGTSFDAISLWDVFEHIKNPAIILAAIRNNLAPRGVLFLQTPSFDSLAARIMHEHSNMFDGLEHVNVYSPRTMRVVAERNGYELLSMETVISEIPIIANFLDYEDPYLGTVEHGGKVAGLIDEDSLHRNLLGYKMQMVLRPKT